jgi:hypothetical protein
MLKKEKITMTNAEFKKMLKEVFEGQFLMSGRNYHSVNELLHVLRYEDRLKCLKGVNLSVAKLDGEWTCITCLEAFVDLATLSVWFDDDSVEFDTDEFEFEGTPMRFDNITVYEKKVRIND